MFLVHSDVSKKRIDHLLCINIDRLKLPQSKKENLFDEDIAFSRKLNFWTNQFWIFKCYEKYVCILPPKFSSLIY